MRDFDEMLKEVRAELSEIEPRYFALKETERGLAKLASQNTVELELAIPADTFASMTARMAALKGLAMVNRPIPTAQLGRMLEQGGFTHNSANFTNSLNTSLDRMLKVYEEVEKTADGWIINDAGREMLRSQTDV